MVRRMAWRLPGLAIGPETRLHSRAAWSGLRPRGQDTSGVVACPEGDPVEGGADDDPNVSSITCNARLHHETMLLYAGLGQVGHQMAGTDGGRLYGLVVDQTVYAALDAIDEALEQALTAPTER
jgi:hypothetical protein